MSISIPVHTAQSLHTDLDNNSCSICLAYPGTCVETINIRKLDGIWWQTVDRCASTGKCIWFHTDPDLGLL